MLKANKQIVHSIEFYIERVVEALNVIISNFKVPYNSGATFVDHQKCLEDIHLMLEKQQSLGVQVPKLVFSTAIKLNWKRVFNQ